MARLPGFRRQNTKALLYPVSPDLEKSYPRERVIFSAVPGEQERFSSNVTDYAVESGSPIVDHVTNLPEIFTLNGVITGDDSIKMKDMLNRYWKNAEILRYVGRNIFHKVVIESMSINTSADIINGFYVTVQLKQVRTVDLEIRELPAPDPNISDAVRILQSIVSGDDTYTVADAVRVMREIVGIKSDIAEVRNAGYIEIEEYIPIDNLRIPYTAVYGIPTPKPVVADAISVLRSIVFDDDTTYTVRDAITILQQIVEIIPTEPTLITIEWHYNRITDSVSADIEGDGISITGRKLVINEPLFKFELRSGHHLAAYTRILRARSISPVPEKVTLDSLEDKICVRIEVEN